VVLDRKGTTVVAGQVYLLAGPVRLIDAGTNRLQIELGNGHMYEVDAAEVAKLDEAAKGLSHTMLTDIGTNTHAQIDAHIASAAAHGAGAEVVGTDNVQLLKNKTLEQPVLESADANGSRITGVGDPTFPPDAANMGYVDTMDGIVAGALSSHIAASAAHGATGANVGTTNAQTLTNKTLTTPTIVATGFANMNHTHASLNTGGLLDHVNLQSIGSNTHAQIDTKLGDLGNLVGFPYPIICEIEDFGSALTALALNCGSVSTQDTSGGVQIAFDRAMKWIRCAVNGKNNHASDPGDWTLVVEKNGGAGAETFVFSMANVGWANNITTGVPSAELAFAEGDVARVYATGASTDQVRIRVTLTFLTTY